jgi:hypothetical protein
MLCEKSTQGRAALDSVEANMVKHGPAAAVSAFEISSLLLAEIRGTDRGWLEGKGYSRRKINTCP